MSSESETEFEITDGAAWIRLNRPEKRNALSAALIIEVYDHLATANELNEIRCIVITGKGPTFCAGADLKSFPGKMTENSRKVTFDEVLKAMIDSPKPIIAAVNGAAFGGGLGLVGAADIVLTATSARFSFSEVKLGVIPAMISVVCIPKLGVHHAKKLFITGEQFDGRRAVELGLAHRAVESDQLEKMVQEEVDMIKLGGPIAVQEAKKLIRRVGELSIDDAFAETEKWSRKMFQSEEAAEGMRAFREKRKPNWAL